MYGHPVALDQALAARMSELEDVKVRGGIALWRPAIFDIENPAAHFSWNSWHMSGIERKAVNEGFAYYSPIRYSERRVIMRRTCSRFMWRCFR